EPARRLHDLEGRRGHDPLRAGARGAGEPARGAAGAERTAAPGGDDRGRPDARLRDAGAGARARELTAHSGTMNQETAPSSHGLLRRLVLPPCVPRSLATASARVAPALGAAGDRSGPTGPPSGGRWGCCSSRRTVTGTSTAHTVAFHTFSRQPCLPRRDL